MSAFSDKFPAKSSKQREIESLQNEIVAIAKKISEKTAALMDVEFLRDAGLQAVQRAKRELQTAQKELLKLKKTLEEKKWAL